MITVHNLQDGVAKPVVSSIVYESSETASSKVKPGGADGWQAFSGKSTVTWYSPQAASEDPTSSASRLKDMSMDNVNRARMVEIAIGTGVDDLSKIVAKTGETHLLSASDFGNWRKKSKNGFTDVSSRVMLQIDGNMPKTSYSIQYNTQDLGDIVLKSAIADKITKLSNTVNDLGALAGGLTNNDALTQASLTGERMSRYQNMKVMDMSKVKTDGGLKELSFNFRFGQAGIFSGEEEVVKPILALATPFALSTGEGYHSVTGPYPTKVTANRKAVLATASLVKGILGFGEEGNPLKIDTDSISQGGNGAASLIKAFNAATDGVYQAMDYIAESMFPLMKTITVIIGGAVMGPFIAESISWDFNFNNVDEYGYPCEGTFKFGGLTPIRLMTSSDYVRQWGYGVGTNTDMDAITTAQLVESAIEKKEVAAAIKNAGKEANDDGKTP